MRTLFRSFLRTANKYKAAVILNLLGLSLAFAAFIILMIQFQYEWGYDKYHKDRDHIYRLGLYNQETGNQVVLSRPFIDAFIKSSPMIADGALYNGWESVYNFSLDDKEKFYQEKVVQVYPSFLELFDFKMIHGDFRSFEEPNKIVIPESMSEKIFGSKYCVGEKLISGNFALDIIGVYRDFPSNSILKNIIYTAFPKDKDTDFWYGQNYQFFFKVEDKNAIEDIIENFKSNFTHELTNWETADLKFTNISDIYYETDAKFDSNIEKGNKNSVYLIFSLAVLILIVASINCNNFSNSLIPVRLRSINIQKVLGATNGMLRFSLILENMIVCFMSFVLSLFWVKILSLSFLAEMIEADISLDGNLAFLFFTCLLSLLLGAIITIYPVFKMTSYKPSLVLNGFLGKTGVSGKFRYTLVCIQYIATFTLIICSLNILSQNKYVKETSLGFNKDNLVVFKLNNTLRGSLAVLSENLLGSPQIDNISFSQVLFSGSDVYPKWGFKHNADDIALYTFIVDANFLDAMDVKTTDGRSFRKEDNDKKGGTYVVNETARKMYDLELNQKLTVNFNDFAQGEIVGFTSDVNFQSLRHTIEPMCFYFVESERHPYYEYAYVTISSSADFKEAISTIQSVINKIDHTFTPELMRYAEILGFLYKKETNFASLISLFSIMSIIISLVGVLGIVILDNQLRKKEMAIRKVYGASNFDILMLLNKVYLKLLVGCFVVSAPISITMFLKWQANFAYKVSLNWAEYLFVLLLVSVFTILIVTIQSRSVIHENPSKHI